MAEVTNSNISLQEESQPEKGYVLNKGLPPFVADTEIRRLRKVVEEKNALIEKFKKYDEERKNYVAALQKLVDDAKQETADMKEFVDSFKEDIQEVCVNEEVSQDDYEQMVKLFSQWYTYKNHSKLYQGKLKSARSSIRDLKDDLTRLETILKGVGDFRTATQVSDRFVQIRLHLDTLMSKLNV